MQELARKHGIRLEYIHPSKLQQNAYVECLDRAVHQSIWRRTSFGRLMRRNNLRSNGCEHIVTNGLAWRSDRITLAMEFREATSRKPFRSNPRRERRYYTAERELQCRPKDILLPTMDINPPRHYRNVES